MDGLNWDTHEVILWIDNDEPLYHIARRTNSVTDLRRSVEAYTGSEYFTIDPKAVDWKYVYQYLQDEEE